MATPPSKQYQQLFLLLLLLIAVALVLVNVFMPYDERVWTWIVSMLLMVGFLVVASYARTGLLRAVLIDGENRISLSRLQLAVWTIVIVSALLTAAVGRIRAGIDQPLDVKIPEEVWLLLGISTTSLAASPLIKSTKSGTDPDDDQFNATRTAVAAQTGKQKDDIVNRGLLLVNKDPAEAGWWNLITGEETGTGAHLDLSRIQLLFFTAILVISYVGAVAKRFDAGPLTAFPALDPGMITLLGISHAGYLTLKAVPRSQAATPPAA